MEWEIFLSNIHSVEPGQFVKLDSKNFTKKNNWHYPLNNEKFNLSEESLIEKCGELIEEVTSEHLVSDVPIGELVVWRS